VAKEAEEQTALRSDAVGSMPRGDGHHLRVSLAPIGELLALQVRPEPLDRVQLGCAAFVCAALAGDTESAPVSGPLQLGRSPTSATSPDGGLPVSRHSVKFSKATLANRSAAAARSAARSRKSNRFCQHHGRPSSTNSNRTAAATRRVGTTAPCGGRRRAAVRRSSPGLAQRRSSASTNSSASVAPHEGEATSRDGLVEPRSWPALRCRHRRAGLGQRRPPHLVAAEHRRTLRAGARTAERRHADRRTRQPHRGSCAYRPGLVVTPSAMCSCSGDAPGGW